MKYFDSNSLAENTGRMATFLLESTPKLNKKDRVTKEAARYDTGDIVKRSRLVGRLMTKGRFAKVMEENQLLKKQVLLDTVAKYGEGSEQALAASVKFEKKSAPRFEFTETEGVIRSLFNQELQWAIDPVDAQRVSEFFLKGTNKKATKELVGDILPAPKKPDAKKPMILTIDQKTVLNSILPEKKPMKYEAYYIKRHSRNTWQVINAANKVPVYETLSDTVAFFPSYEAAEECCETLNDFAEAK